MKELVINAIALGLLFTPVDGRIKLSLAGLAMIPSGVVVITGLKKYKDVQTNLDQLIKTSDKLTRSNVQNTTEAQQRATQLTTSAAREAAQTKRQAEAEAKAILDQARENSRQIKDDAQAIVDKLTLEAQQQRDRIISELKNDENGLALIRAELEKEKTECIQTRAKLFQDLELLEQRKAEVEHERNLVLGQARAEASTILAKERAELAVEKARVKELESSITIARAHSESELALSKVNWEGDRNSQALKIQQDRQAFELEMQQERNDFEQEVEQKIADLEQQYKDKAATLLQTSNKKLQAASEQQWEDLQQQAAEQLEGEVQERLKPYVQKLQELAARIQQLENEKATIQQRLIMAHERYDRTQKPSVPKGHSVRESMSRDLANFYWRDAGICMDVVTSLALADGTVQVVLCDKDTEQGTTLKKLKDHKNTIQMNLHLAEAPLIEVAAEGYMFLLKPADKPYLGMPTAVSDPIARFAYNPEQFSTANNAKSAIEFEAYSVIEMTQEREKKLAYIPPTQALPTTGQITAAEVEYVDYLYNWRYQSENKPNITSQNDLIEMVWHIKPGYSSDRKNLGGITLRQRLHQIFDILKIEFTTGK